MAQIKYFQPFSLVLDATPSECPRHSDGKRDYGAMVNAALAAFPNVTGFEYAIRNGESRFFVTVLLEEGESHRDIERQRDAFLGSLGAVLEPTVWERRRDEISRHRLDRRALNASA